MTIFQYLSKGSYVRVYYDQRYADGKYVGIFYDTALIITFKNKAELFIKLDKVSAVKILKSSHAKKTTVNKQRRSPFS